MAAASQSMLLGARLPAALNGRAGGYGRAHLRRRIGPLALVAALHAAALGYAWYRLANGQEVVPPSVALMLVPAASPVVEPPKPLPMRQNCGI